MGRLGRLGLEPAVRYERSRPGELVHVDVKKLGRIQGGAGKRVRGGRQHYNPTFTDRDGHRRTTVGWEYVHIAVDDYSRLAYAEVLPDEKATTAIGFLRRAVAFYRRHGIRVERVLTDNGSRLPRHRPRARLPTHSASATSAPAPTGHRQTGKPNASSAPCSPAGPTAPSTAQATNAPPPLTAGSGTTTIDDDTQPSATNPRSAEPTCSGPTARARLRREGPGCSPRRSGSGTIGATFRHSRRNQSPDRGWGDDSAPPSSDPPYGHASCARRSNIQADLGATLLPTGETLCRAPWANDNVPLSRGPCDGGGWFCGSEARSSTSRMCRPGSAGRNRVAPDSRVQPPPVLNTESGFRDGLATSQPAGRPGLRATAQGGDAGRSHYSSLPWLARVGGLSLGAADDVP